MQYDYLSGVDKPISRLVQGTVTLNLAEWKQGAALLDAVYDLGCNTFDSAHGYGDGDSERTLGRWIKERGLRDKVVILTKGAHPYDGRKRVTPEDIASDLHDSLERLQVDHIDLYLLHRDDPDVPVEPIVDILNEHHNAGKIGAFGGSNWTHQRIKEANAYAEAQGLTPFTTSSVQFSLAEMVEEPWADCKSIGGSSGKEARAWYQKQDIALFTWSSLAGGFFSGRFRQDNLDTFDDYFGKLCVKSYCYQDNFRRLDRAERLANEKGLTLPQVALAYVMSQPLNIFALVGCETGAEFEANVAALRVQLTSEELDWLDLKHEDLI